LKLYLDPSALVKVFVIEEGRAVALAALAMTFACFDRRLRQAARAVGLTVAPAERPADQQGE
jgi:hypothetical protein